MAKPKQSGGNIVPLYFGDARLDTISREIWDVLTRREGIPAVSIIGVLEAMKMKALAIIAKDNGWL